MDLGSAEMYTPVLGAFSLTPGELVTPRRDHLAFFLSSTNEVVIEWGTSAARHIASAEIFDVTRGQFRAIDPLSIPGGVLLNSGRNVVALGTATVQTDKQDYYAGETVVITGSGWQPGETVKLVISEDPKRHDDWIHR